MNADKQFIKELKSVIAVELKKIQLEEIREDDIIPRQFAKDNGIGLGPARRLLNKLAEQGYFIKVRIENPNGGGARVAYRPVEKRG